MSVQFGRCNFDGKPVDPQEVDRVRPMLALYGPDAEGIFRKGNLGIIYRAFHTTKESRMESQPHVSPSGAVITWDGRLDNCSELSHELGGKHATDSTDLSIIAAAYEHWGTDCFSRLIGDWALSIWNPTESSLILAKDPIGTRPLYYFIDKEQITWSTILDPLVVFAGTPFTLSEEYVAGWFSFFPDARLTPYVGIRSVPPSSFVVVRPGKHTIKKHWDFDPGMRIRYRADDEYEEHFRTVFAEAVRRRLRSNTPVLAELSGGIDSSSIVCMADAVITGGGAESPRLDTISYYDDSEPNWNERPYFNKVEEKRGRTGCHIDVGKQESYRFDFRTDRFAATPASNCGCTDEAGHRFADCMTSHGNRVMLSGIGGDEVAGGVPTPIPELQDLLGRADLAKLAHQLRLWALDKRRPWFNLVLEAAQGFFPPTLVGVPKHLRPAEWLYPTFVKRHRAALTGYPPRLKLIGPLPSFQENMFTLEGLRRQLTCVPLPSEPCYEKRYPYLDRGLLEFLYAIPREQLVRPGQRRSLTRRALVGIVPSEVLNRRRKAFVVRSPMTAIAMESGRLAEMAQHMVSSSLGMVDASAFCEAVQMARRGKEIHVVALMRTLAIERWLWRLKHNTFVQISASTIDEQSAYP